LSLPGIGAKGADKILELREAKGNLELDDLNQVPYLRITPQLIECLDFTSFENKELEKGEVVSYAEEVCSKVEPIGIQKVEVAEQGVKRMENGKFPNI
jgi:predicted DNA-binding helix-hairpin-helix protein